MAYKSKKTGKHSLDQPESNPPLNEISSKEPSINLETLALPVSDSAEFKNIMLVNAMIRRGHEVSSNKPAKILISKPRWSLTKKDGSLQVLIKLSVLQPSEGDQEPSVEIRAEYVIDYSFKSNSKFDNQSYEAFTKTVSIHHAWPFWREFVCNLSSRMGIPVLMIPLHRITDAKK